MIIWLYVSGFTRIYVYMSNGSSRKKSEADSFSGELRRRKKFKSPSYFMAPFLRSKVPSKCFVKLKTSFALRRLISNRLAGAHSILTINWIIAAKCNEHKNYGWSIMCSYETILMTYTSAPFLKFISPRKILSGELLFCDLFTIIFSVLFIFFGSPLG